MTTTEKLTDIFGLETEIGIPVRSLRTLVQKRKIPFMRCGHRTLLFSPAKVRAALDRFEVKEIGAN